METVSVEIGEFEVPQSYETTITRRSGWQEPDPEFVFLCAPLAAIHERNRDLLDDPRRLLEDVLGLSDLRELRVAELPDAILTLLVADALGDDAGDGSSLLERASDAGWLAEAREAYPEANLFAEYLAFAEIVPFEQSKLSVSSLATLARKSYGIPGQVANYIGLGSGAAVLVPALVPHVAVAYLGVAATGGLAVGVVDSIGVIAGVAASPRTAGAIAGVQRGIRRLIHRPPADDARGARNAPSAGSAPETVAQHGAAEAEQERKRHQNVVEEQARLKNQARHGPHGPRPAKE
jgi:hypothetical protein